MLRKDLLNVRIFSCALLFFELVLLKGSYDLNSDVKFHTVYTYTYIPI